MTSVSAGEVLVAWIGRLLVTRFAGSPKNSPICLNQGELRSLLRIDRCTLQASLQCISLIAVLLIQANGSDSFGLRTT